MSGSSWTNSTNWKDSTVALNDWYGVGADTADVVSRLWLGGNGLVGSVPSSLGDLSGIDTLNVGGNQLSGSLPAELGNASELRYLSFWNNQLSGGIPTELGQLTELVHLSFSANNLTGEVPSELGSLTKLEGLYIYNNQLTGELPSELTALTEMRRFLARNNASLCRPNTTEFTAWLNGIEHTDALNLPTCAEDPPPPPPPPAQPTGLQVDTDSDTPVQTMELSFGEVADAVAANTQYRVKGREAGASWTDWATLAAVTVDSGKVSGRTGEHATAKAYEVQVRACGDTQSDETCSDASASAFGATASPSPTSASADSTSPASTSALLLSWTIEGAAHAADAAYEIGYSSDTTDTAPATFVDSANVPAFTDSSAEVSGLAADTEYRLFVRSTVAWDTTRYYESPWTSATARTEPETITPPPPPAQPTGLQAETDSDTPSQTMELSFGEVADAVTANTQYRVKGREAGASWTDWATLAAVTVDSGKVSGRTGEHATAKAYEVQVRACGDTQSDETCSDASASAFGATASPSPTSASADSTSPASTSALLLSWTIEGAADAADAAYEIGYSSDTTDTAPATFVDSADVPAFTDSSAEVSGLAADTEYRLFVRSTVAWDTTRYYESPWASATARTEPETTDPPPPPPPVNDRGTLEGLYDAMSGSSWTNSTNWKDSTVALNDWYGVGADTADIVSKLWLGGNGLAGSVPSSLGDLSGIDTLNVGGNQLSGSFPAELGNASKLRYLSFWNNRLSGGIPTELGQLTELVHLSFSANNLTGEVPSELGSLTKLEGLYIYNNQLTGELPSELTALTEMRRFLARNNTSLCRPNTTEFTAWLNGMEDTDALNLPTCAEDPPPPPPPPAQPTGLHVDTDSDTPAQTMGLSFGEVADAVAANTQYRVKGREAGASWTAWATLAAVTVDSGKVSGRTGEHATAKAYEVQVRACGDTQSDETCSDASASAFGATASPSPTSASADSTSPASTSALLLSWTIEGAADAADAAYEIGYSSDTTDTAPATFVDSADVPAFTDSSAEVSGLAADTEYRLFVRSTVAWDTTRYYESPWASATARTEPETTDPPPPPPSAKDRAILAALYDATEGSSWTNSTNWKDSTAVLNDWYGITADDVDRVTVVRLSSNSLSGTLPDTLGFLAHLDTLDLSSNQLTGAIASGLGNLEGLAYLSLHGNQLSGEIPVELGSFTGLRQLHLNDNELEGELPTALTSLDSLTHFLVSGNTSLCLPSDTTLNAWIAGIANTDAADLGSCEPDPPPEGDRAVLTHIYKETGGSNWTTKTNWLDAEADLDDWYGVTAPSGSVYELLLYENNLTNSIPKEIGSLASLIKLGLGHNKLTGKIPAELGDIEYLFTLNLSNNQLSGEIPPGLGSLSRLGILRLEDNQLTGEIPSELGNLSTLQLMQLQNNELSGKIPSEIGKLASLLVLNLRGNQLTGSLPKLGGMKNLSSLDLRNNDLSGALPEDLTLLSVENLRVSGNTSLCRSADPDFTTWLNGLKYTDALDLPSCFTPAYPNPHTRKALVALHTDAGGTSWTTSTNWTTDASLNDWYGITADSVDNVSAVKLANNRLSGTLTTLLADMTDLDTLDLADNQLTGAIPYGLNDLAKLRYLSLANNQLSGAIPVALADLSSLKTFSVGGNTGLCRPDNSRLTKWLDGLESTDAKALPTCGTIIRAEKFHLNQVNQDWAHTVPTLADRPGLLRVFLTGQLAATDAKPKVRATFYNSSGDTVFTATERIKELPWDLTEDEENYNNTTGDPTWNVHVPDSVFQQGMEFVVEVDPDDEVTWQSGSVRRLPTTGRQAIAVTATPAFKHVIVPTYQTRHPGYDDDIQTWADSLTEDHPSLLGSRAVWPIDDYELVIHEPFSTDADLATSAGWSTWSNEIEALSNLEDAEGYYYGAAHLPSGTPLLGRAEIEGHSAVGETNPHTMAHELGHNLSLWHATGCGAVGSDSDFPNSFGYIHHRGYDPFAKQIKSPKAHDVMAYCESNWGVSAHNFKKSLNYRLTTENAGMPQTFAARGKLRPGLLVWGRFSGQKMILEPAFLVDAPPTPPTNPGDYHVSGTGRDGQLFSVSFDINETILDPVPSETRAPNQPKTGNFAFVIPIDPAALQGLERIVFGGPSGYTMMTANEREPMALVHNPRTGQFRGFVRNWTGNLPRSWGSDRNLSVSVSRGIPRISR